MTAPDIPPEIGGTVTDLARLIEALVRELERGAPPKVEGGSDARRQWLGDILAVQAALHEVGLSDEFARVWYREAVA